MEKRKMFLLSFDDGTVYDPRLVELLNRYGIKGTFNLNSGLEDFVWCYEGYPIRRQRLADTTGIYRGHEIASHSVHHPMLTALSEEELNWQIGEDCRALKETFQVGEVGFAVPFTACGEREIGVARRYARYVRLSECSDSFALPQDPYHIPIHGLYHDTFIREKLRRFAECDLPEALFVMCGHSYELEMLEHWDYFENLLGYIQSLGVESMTTLEFVKEYYPCAET